MSNDNIVYAFGAGKRGDHGKGVASQADQARCQELAHRLEMQVGKHLKSSGQFRGKDPADVANEILGNEQNTSLATMAASLADAQAWEHLLIADAMRRCYHRVLHTNPLDREAFEVAVQSAVGRSMADFSASEFLDPAEAEAMQSKLSSAAMYLFDRVISSSQAR